MKPRIAFCFSWQARTFDITYTYFKKNLFDAAIEQWFEYDIFCAVEDDSDMEKIYQMNPTVIEKIESKKVVWVIEKYYQDFISNSLSRSVFFVENLSWTMFLNYLQQLYKISRSNTVKNEYAKKNNILYDVVIRVRFDLLFLDSIDFLDIKQSIEKNEKSIVLSLPKDTTNIYDVFAFWWNESMEIYSNMFFQVASLFVIQEKRRVHARIYLLLIYLIQFFGKRAHKITVRGILMSFLSIVTSFFRDSWLYILDAEHALLKSLHTNNIHIIPRQIPFILLKENPWNNYLHI